jgi:hypothetical protein
MGDAILAERKAKAEPAETFPQYIIDTGWQHKGFAYFLRTSPTECMHGNASGCVSPYQWQEGTEGNLLKSGRYKIVTESEAKQRVRRKRIVYNNENGVYYRFHTADPNEFPDIWREDGRGWLERQGYRPQSDTLDWPEVPDPSTAPEPTGMTNAQARAAVVDHERRLRALEAGR